MKITLSEKDFSRFIKAVENPSPPSPELKAACEQAKKFKDLRKAMNPEAQARAHEKAAVMKAALPCAELRQARHSLKNSSFVRIKL